MSTTEDIVNLCGEKVAGAVKALECPHCQKQIQLVAHVPDEQRISFALTLTSEWCGAATFGHSLVNLDKIFKESAKSLGARVEVYIESIEQGPQRIQANLVLVAVAGKKPKMAKAQTK